MIKCTICNKIYEKLPFICSCGNTDLMNYIRIDKNDINPVLHERDKEWLESKNDKNK